MGNGREIEFYDDVFDVAYCRFLLEDARKHLSQGRTFARSNFHWNARIVRASQPVLVRDYSPHESAFILAALKKRGIVETSDYMVMNYAWTRLSYIPWHNDGIHTEAITVYLNENWNRDWGGLFLYGDVPHIRGYAPRFNTAVKNSSNLDHSVTPVALDAEEPRYTIQVFPKPSERA